MSNALVTKPIQSVSHAQTWTPEQVDLVKRTICVGATDDELKLFTHVAQRSGLDPFARQIHAVKRQGKMTIQVGIDGFRLIADRTGTYAGSDDPVFDDEKKPRRATVTIYKMVQGTRCPFTATARWDEYYPGDAQGFMWKKMPCLMLSKVAESLALRKAFPAELSGLYEPTEMEQAGVSNAVPKPDENGGDGVIDLEKMDSKTQARRAVIVPKKADRAAAIDPEMAKARTEYSKAFKDYTARFTSENLKSLMINEFGVESSSGMTVDQLNELVKIMQLDLAEVT